MFIPPLEVVLGLVTAMLLVSLGSAVYFRQPQSRLRRSVIAIHAAVLLFVLGDLGAELARSVAEKHIALSILYSGTIWIPPALWFLAITFLEESDRRPAWVPAWALRAAVAFAAVMWVGAITNPIHGQFVTPVLEGRNAHHWLWVVYSVGSYTVVGAACGLCIGTALRRDAARRIRQQAGILSAGLLVPFVTNLAYNLSPWQWPFDPSIAALGLTVVCLAVGVYGLGLFGLSPVSIRAALLSDPSAVLLIDRAGRLVFENGSASRLLGAGPLDRRSPALARLATQLRTAEGDEPVPESDLWGLIGEQIKQGSGTLYRLVTPTSKDDRWLWISGVPVSSRWRESAAYCFRVQDVTRLRQSERDRIRLEERSRKRGTTGRPISTLPRPIRTIPVDWPSYILRRFRDLGDSDQEEGPSAAAIDRVLAEIDRNPLLREKLGRMDPYQAWLEFKRMLSRA